MSVAESAEAATDAQFADSYADIHFYERGYPLADFADDPPCATKSDSERKEP